MKKIEMHKVVAVFFACLMLAAGGFTLNGCSSSSTDDSGGGGGATLTLTSADITSGGTIGSTYALSDCGGSNASPQLGWSGDLPSGFLSLAVTVLDQDASDFVHWSVYNIPTTVTSIAQAASAADIGTDVAFGPNGYDAHLQQYDGPCPPNSGDTHTYQFKLWALDIADLTTDTTITFTDPDSVVNGISSHALTSGTASFTATYTAP